MPIKAVNAVPNPAQIAYAVDNGKPLSDKPKKTNDNKKT